MNKKYDMKFLKKMSKKYPEDKELKEFLDSIEEKECKESTNSGKSPDDNVYVRSVHIPGAIVDRTQELINAGITDAKTLHEKTGIPMEALAAMGIDVPVREYVVPVTCQYIGLVSVKAVSPEDAFTTLACSHNNAVAPTGIIREPIVSGLMDDEDLSETLTNMHEKGLIPEITDSKLASPIARNDYEPELIDMPKKPKGPLS